VSDDTPRRPPPVDPELVREVLEAALVRGGGFAEVFVEERTSTGARLDDGRIEEVVHGLERGAGVRVVHGEASAYAFSNRLDRVSLLEAATAAAASVRHSGPSPAVDLRKPGPVATHPVAEPPDDVPRQRVLGWLKEADDTARSYDPSVRQVVVGYGDAVQRQLVATSDGRWVEEERPRIRLIVQAVAARDAVIQSGSWGPAGLAGAEFLRAHPPAETATIAARQAVTMLDGVPAPAGEMPVVIGPGGGGVLFHEACGHGLEADLIAKESSIYTGRLGESLASPLVTGVDDATVAGAWGSFAFDDEGEPSERTVLFQGGVLRSFLYDRMRAERDGRASTGNGRRQSYAHLPIPRMTNTYILPGSSLREDVIADTASGLYAAHLGGGQVNPATGDFVFGVTEAYLIEKGELTRPVRGANLVGNGIGILRAIDAVCDDFETLVGTCGKEGQGVPVGNGSPSLRIARMTVGGTGARG
jgi:TldD protein